MKLVINHAPSGIVIDGDTLARFCRDATAANDGDRDAIAVLPSTAVYIAEMLRPLLED